MRCFLAIALADETRAALERLQADLPLGREVPAENLHLTLAFLDDRSVAELEALHDGLEALRLPAPRIEFAGLGVFGGKRPSSLHAAVAASAELRALHARIRGLAAVAGFALPRERFHPHVTLARFSGGLTTQDEMRLARYLGRFGSASVPGFTASAVTLFRSTLGRGAPVYDPLSDYPFGPAATDGA
ncbi:MAG: RNA 2',3'-cyclic phosphodiesterase [Rhodobacteraceae bacterium]|nr:RNA 2',3'-cyclic phosphodiesterase [Paracoccaceae bacterium]